MKCYPQRKEREPGGGAKERFPSLSPSIFANNFFLGGEGVTDAPAAEVTLRQLLPSGSHYKHMASGRNCGRLTAARNARTVQELKQLVAIQQTFVD